MNYIVLINNENFAVNLDLFETNIINLSILLIGLFVVTRNFFKELLGSRKAKIVLEIENAETSLNDSQ